MNSKYFFLFFYYFFARYLPSSRNKIFGSFSKYIRFYCCKNIFKNIGCNVNIERGVTFGKGFDIEIGDFSGLGINSRVPNNIKIGKYVMMGPDVIIYDKNHLFSDVTKPMITQGMSYSYQTTIGDDVWIGERVMIMAGKNLGSHTIIGAGAVVAKDIPDWGVAVGNPAKVIKFRKNE